MEVTASQVFAYRGLCKHGKVRVMIVDSAEWVKETAREVADCIARGLTVDRVTVEEARKSDMDCPECEAQWKQPK